MPITEKDVKRVFVFVLLALLGVLVFLILRPVIMSVLAGLILAYVFLPVHRFLKIVLRSRNASAAVVTILLLAITVVPLYYLLPMMSQQVFSFFTSTQNLDINQFIKGIFPAAADQFVVQADATISKAITQVTSSVLNSIVDVLINFVTISLHLFLVAFVFFFALRDHEALKEFVTGLSPLHKVQEKRLTQQFKDITQSLIYGQIVIGLIQGILAGIGFYMFGISNPLLLTALAVILSIIPVIGPSVIYVPLSIYMFSTGDPLFAALFLAYNIIFVSTIDNVLRAHWVSRKTQVSQVIVLIGMIGGLFVFGILGLILGPLILGYFLTFLNAYKDKTLSSLFTE